jgi:hypothetical protein
MNCCFRITLIARVTPSMSALTKFSVTGSPRKRFGDCAMAGGTGSRASDSSVAVRARGQRVRAEWELGVIFIRSI